MIRPGASGFFSRPQLILDPQLFEGMTIRSHVRQAILDMFYNYMSSHFHDPTEWSMLWLAGSGIGYQWRADRGNGDLDVLFGLDYNKFLQSNPAYAHYTREEIAEGIDNQLKKELWPSTSHVTFSSRSNSVVNSYVWENTHNKTQRIGFDSTKKDSDLKTSESVTESQITQSELTLKTKKVTYREGTVAPEKYVEHAEFDPLTWEVSAKSAKKSISETTTYVPNMASAPKNSDSFLQNKMAAANYAEVTSPNLNTGGTLTTATYPEKYEESSVLRAIGPSDNSEIQKKPYYEPSITSEEPRYFEVTYFLNPTTEAKDESIKLIQPYAAFNLTLNKWTVDPIKVSDNPEDSYPEEYREAADANLRHAKELEARYRHLTSQRAVEHPHSPVQRNIEASLRVVLQEIRNMYDSIHLGRREAFSQHGGGYGDYYNFQWQAAKRDGIVNTFNEILNRENQ